MSGPAWKLVRELLEELLALDEGARPLHLDARLASDTALRREVEELLALDAPLPRERSQRPPLPWLTEDAPAEDD